MLILNCVHEQCDQIWQNLRHFGKNFKVFGNILMVNFLFVKMLKLLWQICFITGLIFVVAKGQILKHNLTIWSHCS